MLISRNKRPAGRLQHAAARAAILLAALVGCASPGPPLPPSLKLPEVVSASELSATRVGDLVELHWTTPTHTTDKLLIDGPITAVLCRQTLALPPPAPTPVKAGAARPAAARQQAAGKPVPCSPVERRPVAPGPSDAVDPLPPSLTAGLPRLLAYRVELLNDAGRTAGPSPAVYAVAGAAPPPVEDFHGEDTKAGVVLEWKRAAPASPANASSHAEAQKELATTVELARTTVSAPPAAAAPSAPKAGLLGNAKEPAEVRFAAGNTDAGGAIDRTAQIGYTYSYTAQRVVSVMAVNGETLELRSAPSPAIELAVRDVFPPAVPQGLVAVPGFAAEGETQHPAIDLSWEPDIEPRVAGYRVYRRESLPDNSGVWRRLAPELVAIPAYRDATVVPGHAYGYRISAVSDAGNESAPSAEVTETAPEAP